ncbi:TPA: hypothetical protein ACN976_004977 [Vibrio campbellii]|uniref:hypothetical protein n=1 Tax=Vibrio campbellii TaxID=680 RepID=UPI0003AA644F|nr:hypothetical protein [Vibrio campbellii]
MLRKSSFFLLIIVFHYNSAFSSELYGHVTGNSPIIWNNAVPVPSLGGIAASYWSIKEPRTTTEWYPGSLSNPQNELVAFTNNETGESFQTLVERKGVEYNLGSSSSVFKVNTYSDGNVGTGVASICSSPQIGLNLASISHDAGTCASNSGYLSIDGRRYTPFKFIRAVINVPNLVQDIQGKESGRYTAVIDSSPIYFYKSETGVLTYLQDYEPIIIQIDYTAAFFTDAKIVLGNGVIHPNYDKVNQSVNGKTVYRVQVDGLFPDGIKMTFETSKDYSLISSVEPSISIPYSILCQSGCTSSGIIVDNGKFDETTFPGGEVVSDTRSTSESSLFVDFEINYNQLGSELISSSYSDQFSVIFEANL